MKIKFLFLGLLTLIVTTIFADGITIEEARQVAKNFYFEKSGTVQTKINFVEETVFNSENTPAYFIFNMEEEKGFVIVSADDVIAPIIGYSLENTFETENQPENVVYWMAQYSAKIEYIQDNNIAIDQETITNWQKYNISYSNFTPEFSQNKTVPALTGAIQWSQSDGWNQYCPLNSGNEQAVTGCVSTAMGIIMKYHSFPTTGNGTYTYSPDGYTAQTVNYGASTYSWSSMDNTSPNSSSAVLIYHAGVSVQMQYGTDGSSAYTMDVLDALWYYFLYQYPTSCERVNYEDTDWKDILKTDLNAYRPIFYAGNKTSGGGHAFICDGYDDSDLFHYNFGWGGYQNGFYSIDNPQDYSDEQDCIVGITPDNSFFAKDIRKNAREENSNCLSNIYPNPTNGVVNIFSKDEIYSVEIYNITGSQILKTNTTENIDISNNPAGIYFININTENGTIIEKIVLK